MSRTPPVWMLMREDFLSSFSFSFVSVMGNTLIYFILTLSALTSFYYDLFIVLVNLKKKIPLSPEQFTVTFNVSPCEFLSSYIILFYPYLILSYLFFVVFLLESFPATTCCALSFELSSKTTYILEHSCRCPTL